jgi:hypothetical protein
MSDTQSIAAPRQSLVTPSFRFGERGAALGASETKSGRDAEASRPVAAREPEET